MQKLDLDCSKMCPCQIYWAHSTQSVRISRVKIFECQTYFYQCSALQVPWGLKLPKKQTRYNFSFIIFIIVINFFTIIIFVFYTAISITIGCLASNTNTKYNWSLTPRENTNVWQRIQLELNIPTQPSSMLEVAVIIIHYFWIWIIKKEYTIPNIAFLKILFEHCELHWLLSLNTIPWLITNASE